VYRSFRSLGFVLLVAAAASFAVAQEKKDPDKDRKDGEKLVKVGDCTGTITGLGENKNIKLKVTFRYLEPNPSAFQNQQNLVRRQFEILRNTNPAERQQQLAQLAQDVAQNQRNLYHPKEVHRNLELQPTDNVRVRSMQPPLAYDDKGNPRKYTARELQDLKGEHNLPGYMSEWGQLRAGQIATVTVYARKKDTAPAAAPKGKDADKELERKLLETEKPYASMIVILGEPPSK
jgi:hypothetical protein